MAWEMILTISGFICGAALGSYASYALLRSRLLNAQRTVRLFANWWIAAQDRLDAIHDNHVRAGKTRHAAYRAHVRETAERLREGLGA